MRLGFWLAISLVTLPASAVAQTAAVNKEAPSEPAISVLRQEADAGNPEAQYKLALRYLDSTSQLHNDTEGLQWLRRAADAGHAFSSQLGIDLPLRRSWCEAGFDGSR
jgi:TPR repeat protein